MVPHLHLELLAKNTSKGTDNDEFKGEDIYLKSVYWKIKNAYAVNPLCFYLDSVYSLKEYMNGDNSCSIQGKERKRCDDYYTGMDSKLLASLGDFEEVDIKTG